MHLRVVGAGLPRTGTSSLKLALEHLLGTPCYHMSAIPTHPFDLGAGWDLALAGGTPGWDTLLEGYVATADWPASMFWRELSTANPDALVVLSVRDSAEAWYRSFDEMILPHVRASLAPGWSEGRGLVALLERFSGTQAWDEPALLMAAYEQHNAEVRKTVPPDRLLEWRATQGWEPLCRALGLPAPDLAFPRIDGRGSQ